MQYFKAAIFACGCLMFQCCIDPINFPISNESQKIIISGQLTNIIEDHYINVSMTPPQNAKPVPSNGVLVPPQPVPIPINDASVYLKDGQGNQYHCSLHSPGKYKVLGLEAAVDGVDYWVEITVENVLYKSKLERLSGDLGSDSTYYKIPEDVFISKDGKRLVRHLNIFTSFNSTFQNEFYVRWDLREVYLWDLTFFPNPFNTPPPLCYISGTVDPQRINLFHAKPSVQYPYDELLGIRDIDQTFKNRHYIIVRQLSITKESHDYWLKVKALLENTGSVFDVPPAYIQGNIYNSQDSEDKVLGYFEVCKVSESRFFLVPGYFTFYLDPYCEYDPEKPFDKYPKECISCPEIIGNINGPVWF